MFMQPRYTGGVEMKYFYECLLTVVAVLAFFAFFYHNMLIGVGGIALFFGGCLFEYLYNRNKS